MSIFFIFNIASKTRFDFAGSGSLSIVPRSHGSAWVCWYTALSQRPPRRTYNELTHTGLGTAWPLHSVC